MNDIINNESLEVAFYGISIFSVTLIVAAIILLSFKHDQKQHNRVYRKHSHAGA